MSNLTILKKCYLFESFNEAEIESISQVAKEKDLIAGDYVFDEGAFAKSLYVVVLGSVDILKKIGDGDEQKISSLSQGSHFGEIAFLDETTRTAAVMARENLRLLEILFEDLNHLIQSKPDLGVKFYKSIAQSLCKRIRNTTNDLSSLKVLKLRSQ